MTGGGCTSQGTSRAFWHQWAQAVARPLYVIKNFFRPDTVRLSMNLEIYESVFWKVASKQLEIDEKAPNKRTLAKAEKLIEKLLEIEKERHSIHEQLKQLYGVTWAMDYIVGNPKVTAPLG